MICLEHAMGASEDIMVHKGASGEKEVGACLDDGRKRRTMPCIARVLVGRVRAPSTHFTSKKGIVSFIGVLDTPWI